MKRRLFYGYFAQIWEEEASGEKKHLWYITQIWPLDRHSIKRGSEKTTKLPKKAGWGNHEKNFRIDLWRHFFLSVGGKGRVQKKSGREEHTCVEKKKKKRFLLWCHWNQNEIGDVFDFGPRERERNSYRFFVRVGTPPNSRIPSRKVRFWIFKCLAGQFNCYHPSLIVQKKLPTIKIAK